MPQIDPQTRSSRAEPGGVFRPSRLSTALLAAVASLALGGALVSHAQVPDAPGAAAPASPAPAPSSGPGAKGQGSFLGKDVPSFDPGTEILAWTARLNVNNNRLFQARFEKYLNAPKGRLRRIDSIRPSFRQILTLLAPGQATREKSLDRGLPPAAARFELRHRRAPLRWVG